MTTERRSEGQGFLIAFEGIDGTGKTTQIKMLAQALNKKGFEVVATREPTDGKFGRQIRALYTDRGSVTPEQELQLFIDDRKEHVKELIAPAMAAGKVVLTDRYYFSTAAYQGANGQDPEYILAENEKFAPLPDLVLLLEAPVSVGIHRVSTMRNETPNDFEQEEMLAKVAAIFAGLSGEYIKRVDSTGTAEAVHEAVMVHVEAMLAAATQGSVV